MKQEPLDSTQIADLLINQSETLIKDNCENTEKDLEIEDNHSEIYENEENELNVQQFDGWS